MKQYTFDLYGHHYTVEVNSENTVVRCACLGRWPMCDVRFLGDEWLLSELQCAVDGME